MCLGNYTYNGVRLIISKYQLNKFIGCGKHRREHLPQQAVSQQ
jgi:hypothetical protein